MLSDTLFCLAKTNIRADANRGGCPPGLGVIMAFTTSYETRKFRPVEIFLALSRFDYRDWFWTGWRRTLLVWLIVLDMIAIGSDVVALAAKELGYLSRPDAADFFRLGAEYGLSGLYGYAKLFVISGLLFTIFRQTGLRSYLFLALTYFYTALDDTFIVHERVGRLLLQLTEATGQGGQLFIGLSETAYFLIVGPVIVGLIALAIVRAPDAHRAVVSLLGLLLLAIGFCAVFLNLVEAMLKDMSRYAMYPVSLMDDGGELVFASLATVLALATWRLLCGANSLD